MAGKRVRRQQAHHTTWLFFNAVTPGRGPGTGMVLWVVQTVWGVCAHEGQLQGMAWRERREAVSLHVLYTRVFILQSLHTTVHLSQRGTQLWLFVNHLLPRRCVVFCVIWLHSTGHALGQSGVDWDWLDRGSRGGGVIVLVHRAEKLKGWVAVVDKQPVLAQTVPLDCSSTEAAQKGRKWIRMQVEEGRTRYRAHQHVRSQPTCTYVLKVTVKLCTYIHTYIHTCVHAGTMTLRTFLKYIQTVIRTVQSHY